MSRSRSTSNFGDLPILNEGSDFYDVFNTVPMNRHLDDATLRNDKAALAAIGGAALDNAPPAATEPAPHHTDVAEAPLGAAADEGPTTSTISGASPTAPTSSTTGTATDAPATAGEAPVGTNTGIGGGIFIDPTAIQHIEGTDDGEVISGTFYDDEVHGGGGNDTIEAGSGKDHVWGDEGSDTLDGGLGDDILEGGTGNDTLRGGEGADTLIGGEGMDNVSYVTANSGVIVDLATGGVTNDAAGDTYSGIENVFGTAYGDIINGDNQANVLHGYSGDDFLFGQGGDDRIFGDLGWDILRGGAGNDILNGGQGKDRLTGDDAGQFGYDTFVLQNGNGVDIITDFQQGYDKIDLRGYGLSNTSFGWDGQLAVGQTWGDLYLHGGLEGGDRLVFDPYEHTLYQVSVAYDNDYGAWYVSGRQEIVVLQGVDTLSAQDLILS